MNFQFLHRFEITKKLKQQQKMQGKSSGKKGTRWNKAKGSDDEAEEGQVGFDILPSILCGAPSLGKGFH